MATFGTIDLYQALPEHISQYNKIKPLSEQRHSVAPSTLQSLAHIFIKHESHENLGISLLHRHQSLLQGHVMVHSTDTHCRDVCRMVEKSSGRFFPCAFLLDQRNRFVTFEYSQTPTSTPSPALLLEVASFLELNALQETLAIAQVSPSERPWTEHLLPNRQGTISTQMNERDLNDVDYVFTEWGFQHDGGEPQVRCLKACKEAEGGGHKVE